MKIKKILMWIFFPYRMYQLYFIQNVMQEVVTLLNNKPLHTIKIVKYKLTQSLVIVFYDQKITIKFSPNTFFIKNSTNKEEILETEIWTKKVDFNAHIDAILKTEQVQEFFKKIKNEFYLTDADEFKMFKIISQDFVRSNPIDKFYAKIYKDKLLALCEYKCFFCNNTDNLQVDHFFVPKCKGGNLILKTTYGFYINNAMILCEGCNKSKSDRSYKIFNDMIDYHKLAQIQLEMNKSINKIDVL